MQTEQLVNELQSFGVRLVDPRAGAASRRGGAGPSDHKAMTIDGMTVMVPVHTAPAFASPYLVEQPDAQGRSRISRDGAAIGEVSFPAQPKFYARSTEDGIPYSKIAVLHGRDVLATTVLQSCIRYASRGKTCQFCAIGQSLAAGRTIERKTPAQLAEVARAAVDLDGVKHMVMTTGTPAGNDRGAAILAESAAAVKAAVALPIQAQCEPPDDDAWFGRLRDSGVDALGMHLEAVSPAVRARIMPGKAQVPLARYVAAFRAAVPVFGRGQVSTYILAGLGDTAAEILAMCESLVAIGVYPFVVPFVPISGTPLESHPAPTPDFMHGILQPLAGMLVQAGMTATDVKAGCGKCGACSALSSYERRLAAADQGRGMIFEPFAPFTASAFRVKAASLAWERRGAARLRHQVFCIEQGLFGGARGCDADAVDDVAITLVAVSDFGVAGDEVVGTVRIHEASPGEWWGSRLAVSKPYRRVAALGQALIRLAVSTAHAHGCRRFLADVQTQNAPLFRRLHWQDLAALDRHGRPHARMQADMEFYPPFQAPEAGLYATARSAG